VSNWGCKGAKAKSGVQRDPLLQRIYRTATTINAVVILHTTLVNF